MPRQLVFDLPVTASLAHGDYFVSTSNRVAHDMVMALAPDAGGKLVLAGPEGAGKSHLAAIWAEVAGARVLTARDLVTEAPTLPGPGPVVVEDADVLAGDTEGERHLFHLHNMVLEGGGGALLVTARTPPVGWGLTLPDLASRMQGAGLATISPPDDALLAAVLVKLFADRQVVPSANLIPYLLKRMERTLDGAARLVDRLDRASLAEGRTLTVKFAATVLERPGAG